MGIELILKAIAEIQKTNLIPILMICSAVAFVGLILLSLLVRYAMIFAIAGTGAFVLLLANFPKGVSQDVVDAMIIAGFSLLTLMLFCYEFILWKQTRAMRSIAMRRPSSRPMYRAGRPRATGPISMPRGQVAPKRHYR